MAEKTRVSRRGLAGTGTCEEGASGQNLPRRYGGGRIITARQQRQSIEDEDGEPSWVS
jgi:hypothetical protein